MYADITNRNAVLHKVFVQKQAQEVPSFPELPLSGTGDKTWCKLGAVGTQCHQRTHIFNELTFLETRTSEKGTVYVAQH